MKWTFKRNRIMDVLESNIHSFIIKIWLEEPARDNDPAIWRGRITHIPSGEKRYLSEIEEIRVFISPYLRKMGFDLSKPK